MHTPVLLQSTIEAMQIRPGGRYIDATFGSGGHSQLILEKGGKVLGIEWDRANFEEQLIKYQSNRNVKLINGNYADIADIAVKNDFSQADGILFDLGISMNQIGGSGKGFSYKHPDEPLDMRINTQELDETAADILNSYPETELYNILAANSEELHARAIVNHILKERKVKKFAVVADLINVLNQIKYGQPSEFAYRRVFQALRIAVNHEFENIKRGLAGALETISETGRIVVITFHPNEDRVVKQAVRSLGGHFFPKKPLKTKADFGFERSAKVRVIKKYET